MVPHCAKCDRIIDVADWGNPKTVIQKLDCRDEIMFDELAMLWRKSYGGDISCDEWNSLWFKYESLMDWFGLYWYDWLKLWLGRLDRFNWLWLNGECSMKFFSSCRASNKPWNWTVNGKETIDYNFFHTFVGGPLLTFDGGGDWNPNSDFCCKIDLFWSFGDWFTSRAWCCWWCCCCCSPEHIEHSIFRILDLWINK